MVTPDGARGHALELPLCEVSGPVVATYCPPTHVYVGGRVVTAARQATGRPCPGAAACPLARARCDLSLLGFSHVIDYFSEIWRRSSPRRGRMMYFVATIVHGFD